MKPVGRLHEYGFRIFFAGAALYAVAVMAGWIGVFTLGWSVAGVRPMTWHAHEMILGVAGAAIAGFLLTAVPNWTRTDRVHGAPLLGLFVLWAAGRAAFWLVDPYGAGPLATLALAIDLAFLPLLAIAIGRPLVATGNRRNLVMVALLIGLFGLDLVLAAAPGARWAPTLALDLVVVMMVIIGGRITPLFTRNWLQRRGVDGSAVQSHAWLNALSLALVVAVAASAALGLAATGALSLAAALALLARLIEWQGWRAWRDPLVWVLHLGYAWIVAALFLRGFGALTEAIPARAWIHAAGVGAMGTLVVGVMARVALGHTGRELRLPKGASAMFWLITVAALARTGNALGWLDHDWPLTVAGAAWMTSFALYLAYYLPVLVAPRADGRPG